MKNAVEWLAYGLLTVPALLVFAIINLWLCVQLKRIWQSFRHRRLSLYGYGYSSYRSYRRNGATAAGHENGLEDAEQAAS
jgi:hypothetical protein